MAEFKGVYTDYYESGLHYEFITEVAPDVWKIVRKDDRMEYLAQDVTDMLFVNVDGRPQELTNYGGLLRHDGHNMIQRVKTVLNHPNLVSLVDCFAMQFSNSGKFGRERWFTVWDYCDAGNLGNLLVPPLPTEDPDTEMKDMVPGQEEELEKTKFLPESLCWHVLTSLLKALMWLHDGVRNVEKDANGKWERLHENLDWEPILHRAIRPDNIFIGHPRRKEWYGPVKLGNYERLTISGHCQTAGYTQTPTLSKVLCSPPGRDFTPFEELVVWDLQYGSVYPRQVSHLCRCQRKFIEWYLLCRKRNQPYTLVSEYRAVGEIIQEMMIEPTEEDHIKRIRSHPARENLQNAKYSARLKNLVVKMMEDDPWFKDSGEEDEPNRIYVTSELYTEAKEGHDWFVGSGSDEANAYVTARMAEIEDYNENTTFTGADYFDSFNNVREVLEEFARMDGRGEDIGNVMGAWMGNQTGNQTGNQMGYSRGNRMRRQVGNGRRFGMR